MKRRKIEIKFPEQQTNRIEKQTEDATLPFTGRITIDLDQIRNELGHNYDVSFREFYLGNTGIRAAIIFLIGLTDKELINNQILYSLMANFPERHEHREVSLKEFITNQALSISDLTEVNNLQDLLSEILTGCTALLIDGIQEVIILGTTKAKARNIEEPVSEALVRGPRIGFTETLCDNTAILRQVGCNHNLSIIQFRVGVRAKKELVIAFIKDIADPSLVDEVKKRIKTINIDELAESGYVEQLIEDNFLSPFPQVQNTERPDRVYSALMEGRIAILLDGSPFALIVPFTFSMLLQSPEDYYERWIPGSLIRLLRFLAAFLSLFAPSMYIAFISFHPGLIPTKLALSIIASREGVPFPALIEALIMEISIEILREAGLRLPKPIGPAMGIVGGLIIGEAAVQAGIISPIMVIVVSLTAISSFAIPQYSAGITLRILRFVAMFCAAVFGLYGIALFFLMLCSHLVKLKSFGVPYVSPAVPYRISDWKDFIVRMPLFMMKRRPKMLNTKDSIRKG
ncbi:spore germination protein [Neobacillus sp. NRS-1170]|uniref:spore germination protein n=1 Tax=Neobacillus sp. NRS-1170 TaxID=3233898 RepID=UPI003D2677F9